jgi:hypothetical protein
MKTLEPSTILAVAAGLFALSLFSPALIPDWYPAHKPVLAADGSPVLGPDGRPVIRIPRSDMAKYYLVTESSPILMGCSGCMFGWWLVRVYKLSGTKK